MEERRDDDTVGGDAIAVCSACASVGGPLTFRKEFVEMIEESTDEHVDGVDLETLVVSGNRGTIEYLAKGKYSDYDFLVSMLSEEGKKEAITISDKKDKKLIINRILVTVILLIFVYFLITTLRLL